MRQALKNLFYRAVHAAGVTDALLRKHQRHVPVLFYHGVTDRRWPGVLDCEKKHIQAADFERQLVFLKERFQVVHLSTYVASLRGAAPLPERCAVITFDDGYADNYSVAFPLLKKHGLPATMFLASDFVAKGTPLWVDRLAAAFASTALGSWEDPVGRSRWSLAADQGRIDCYLRVKAGLKALPDARRKDLMDGICAELLAGRPAETPALFAPLTWKQAREMLDSGIVEIGSHGLSHSILTAMPEDEARREIKESKAAIEELCGRPVTAFSYPNGGHSPALARLVVEAWYTSAVAVGLRLNGPSGVDPYAISRIALAQGDSPALMAATLSGLRARVIALSGGG